MDNTESKVSKHAQALSRLGAAKGGKARAEALSSEQRSEIARHAALARWGEPPPGLPSATHSGDLKIREIVIRAHVLEDGRRLLSGRAVTQAMGLTGRGQGMARFLASKSLNLFVNDKLVLAIQRPIVFTTSEGIRPTFGYEAWVLPELCNAVIEAADQGLLRSAQRPMVQRAKLLVRAFSTVGIIALVDEATGYQADRAKDELMRILEAYISKELLPWTRRFPDVFFHEIYRLHGWKFKEGQHKNRRPQYVGRLVKEVIYEKLPPGVLPELERRNPTMPVGYRRYKHHQFLTPDTGHEHLDKQITAVMTLMRASEDKHEFKRLFARVFPKRGQQLALPLPKNEENGAR